MNYIESQWQTFQGIIPPNAPPSQHKEMKRAFFAGGEALLRTILGFLEPGKDATDADLRQISDT